MRTALLLSSALSLAQAWEVPEKERAAVNPLEVSPEVLAAGEASYKKQCVLCHGESFRGDGSAAAMFQKKPPDLSTQEARERLTDGEIFYKITVGKKPMPSMKTKLSEEERWQIVHYVRSLQAS
jgi:mono/diheme cytochrome c family protein